MCADSVLYRPWCGHCKKLEPTYTQLAAELKGIVNVAKVDGTLAKQVNSRYGIKGFPTIKLFSGKDVVDYTGDRSLNSLKQFAQSKGTINTVQAAKQAVQEKVAEVVDSVHHTVSGKAADPVTDDKLVTQKQNRNDILHAFSLLYSDIVLILTAKTHAAIMLFGIGLFIGVLMPLVMGAFMSNPVNTVKKTQ